jgi:SAM-dependent methyltransferase
MSLPRDLSGADARAREVHTPAQDPWEVAYLRFETPEQEIRKFVARLRRLRASTWPKDTRIVELFCGRGNGLYALERLGFRDLEGVDLSARLVAEYHGRAKCQVADCRRLPLANASKDAVIVQGGLHHLLSLPTDLDEVFEEIRRVLTSEGRVLFVEPWLTPFLMFVHLLAEYSISRRMSPRLDALATMIDYERHSYEQWLSQPEEVVNLARKYFVPLHESFAWGKWNFVGKTRS